MLAAVGGSAQVVIIDSSGVVRKVGLDISLGEARGICEKAGLAVDPGRLVAYVVAAGSPVAEIDLRTMREQTRYRGTRLTGSGCCECRAQRSAVWLDGRLAVAGFDLRPTRRPFRPRITPAEAVLIDTRRWTVRVIARRAGAVRAAGDRLLPVYDGRHPIGGPRRGPGLRVYDRAGDLEYGVLRGERVGDVQVAGRRARLRASAGRSARGRPAARACVIARLRGGRRDIDLIAPR